MQTQERLTRSDAKRIARAAGATDAAVVESYLVLCTDESDGWDTISALKRNQRHLFKTLRRVPRR